MYLELSWALLVQLPTYLLAKLGYVYNRAGRLSRWLAGAPSNEEPVFDLLNCGPRHQFVVAGTRPITVSNCVQSTGHDLYIYWLVEARRLLTEAGIDWHPLIPDLHDAGYFEVREDQADRALDLLVNVAYANLNAKVRGRIPLRGDGAVLNDWGEAVE